MALVKASPSRQKREDDPATGGEMSVYDRRSSRKETGDNGKSLVPVDPLYEPPSPEIYQRPKKFVPPRIRVDPPSFNLFGALDFRYWMIIIYVIFCVALIVIYLIRSMRGRFERQYDGDVLHSHAPRLQPITISLHVNRNGHPSIAKRQEGEEEERNGELFNSSYFVSPPPTYGSGGAHSLRQGYKDPRYGDQFSELQSELERTKVLSQRAIDSINQHVGNMTSSSPSFMTTTTGQFQPNGSARYGHYRGRERSAASSSAESGIFAGIWKNAFGHNDRENDLMAEMMSFGQKAMGAMFTIIPPVIQSIRSLEAHSEEWSQNLNNPTSGNYSHHHHQHQHPLVNTQQIFARANRKAHAGPIIEVLEDSTSGDDSVPSSSSSTSSPPDWVVDAPSIAKEHQSKKLQEEISRAAHLIAEDSLQRAEKNYENSLRHHLQTIYDMLPDRPKSEGVITHHDHHGRSWTEEDLSYLTPDQSFDHFLNTDG